MLALNFHHRDKRRDESRRGTQECARHDKHGIWSMQLSDVLDFGND
jgi:hypothetical protein